jgi:S1-C subfamily serine protease
MMSTTRTTVVLLAAALAFLATPVLAAPLVAGKIAPPAAAKAAPPPFAVAYAKTKDGVIRIIGERTYATGLIVSEDGFIITHRDAINKNEMQVVFSEGLTVKAKVLLRDDKTNLAVLQILPVATEGETKAPADSPKTPATDAATTEKPAATEKPAPSEKPAVAAAPPKWHPLVLGSSEHLAAGAWVATLAYPLGADMKTETDPSLSAGVLMARGKMPTKLAYDGEWLIIDAMMNEGSEGGALLSADGLVLGILAKPWHNLVTDTALNLALPVEVVAPLLKRARETPDPPIKEGSGVALTGPKNGYLGVRGDPLATECRVGGIVNDGPAEKAGLKTGDIITKFAAEEIGSYEDLIAELKKTKPGDKVKLTIKRDGKEQQIEVTLGQYPSK